MISMKNNENMCILKKRGEGFYSLISEKCLRHIHKIIYKLQLFFLKILFLNDKWQDVGTRIK